MSTLNEPPFPDCCVTTECGQVEEFGDARYQAGIEWERDRLVNLAHAIDAEGIPFTPDTFDRLAHMVIEQGPITTSSTPSENGVRWRMMQSIKLKDVRDA